MKNIQYLSNEIYLYTVIDTKQQYNYVFQFGDSILRDIDHLRWRLEKHKAYHLRSFRCANVSNISVYAHHNKYALNVSPSFEQCEKKKKEKRKENRLIKINFRKRYKKTLRLSDLPH